MSLPANFSGNLHEELHRHFRNFCRDFKKAIKSSKDSEELQQYMEQFIDTSKQMDWHKTSAATYHKEEGEKASTKVLTEFKRYVLDIGQTNPQDLLDAISEVERLLNSLKVT